MKRKSLIIIWKVLQWHGTTWLIHREIVRQLDKEMFKLHGQAFLTSFDKVHLHFPNLRKLLTFLEKKKVLLWLRTQNISIAYSSFVIIRLNKSFTSIKLQFDTVLSLTIWLSLQHLMLPFWLKDSLSTPHHIKITKWTNSELLT